MSSGLAGLRLNTAEPHRPQNHFSKPPSGAQQRSCSSPSSSWKEPGSGRPLADEPVPVRRWQRVQWQ